MKSRIKSHFLTYSSISTYIPVIILLRCSFRLKHYRNSLTYVKTRLHSILSLLIITSLNIYIAYVNSNSDRDHKKVGVGLTFNPVLSHTIMSTDIRWNDKEHLMRVWMISWVEWMVLELVWHSDAQSHHLFFFRSSLRSIVLETTLSKISKSISNF